jgi:transcription-repair coupling factor (superfamily II helicase)
MTEAAEARLQAVQEFTDLGSGFKIAMRDLEIRGAGNLLGPEQSGHLEAVGLEMYLAMLGEAVRTLRGEQPTPAEEEPALDLPVEAVIPAGYVPDERQRISIYRRLAAVKSAEELAAMTEEIRDRFGPLVAPVENLTRIVQLKLACREVGIASVAPQSGRIYVKLRPTHKLTARERRLFTAVYRPRTATLAREQASVLPRVTFEALQISFAYDPSRPKRIFAAMQELAERLTAREMQVSRLAS